MRSALLLRVKPAPQQETDEWWHKLLEAVRGGKVVIPHTSFQRYGAGNPPVPTMLIRVRVPYEPNRKPGDNGLAHNHPRLRACVDRLCGEIKALGSGNELEVAMKHSGLCRFKFEIIDTGKVEKRRYSQSDTRPQPLIENVLA